MKNQTKKPFFAQFLSNQADQKGRPYTLKFPSDIEDR